MFTSSHVTHSVVFKLACAHHGTYIEMLEAVAWDHQESLLHKRHQNLLVFERTPPYVPADSETLRACRHGR
jgi:hypothetical protein